MSTDWQVVPTQPTPQRRQPAAPTQPAVAPAPAPAGGEWQVVPTTPTRGQRPVPPAPQAPLPQPRHGLLGTVEGVASNVNQAVPSWVGAAYRTGVERPVGWALAMLGKPAEITEHVLTGGKGYDEWLKGVAPSMDPRLRGIGAGALRVVLDPTNLLMFPGAVEKGAVLGARYGGPIVRSIRTATNVPGRIAQDAEKVARAHGLDGPVAEAHGALEAGLATEPMQPVRGAVAQVVQHLQSVSDAAIKVFDRAHGLGAEAPIAKDILRIWNGKKQIVIDQARRVAIQVLRDLPDDHDRRVLFQFLEGGIASQLHKPLTGEISRELQYFALDPAKYLPDHLRPAYDNITKIINADTERALKGGFISHARDNYIRHVFSPEALQKIRGYTDELSGASAGARQAGTAPRPIGTTIGASHERVFPTSAEARAAGFQTIEDAAVSAGMHHMEIGLAETNADMLVNVAQRLGPRLVQLAHEAPADWVPMSKIVGNPTAERTLVRGTARVEPAVVRGRYVAKARVIEGEAAPLPRVRVGERWSQQLTEEELAQREAARTRVRTGTYLSDYSVHPEVARMLDGLITGGGHQTSELLKMTGSVLSGYKKWTFYFPMVHGWNVVRSAFLADGLNAFNIRRWQEMVRDGNAMGEWTQRRLAAGGTMATGPNREHFELIDELMNLPHAKGALLRDGESWSELRKEGLSIPGVLKQKSDDFLWNQLDRGLRNHLFRTFVERGHSDEEAARLTDSFMNNYSRNLMTDTEKRFAGYFFTYAWNKGRAQLFGNMARSMMPGSALSATERAAYQRAVTRWAITNMVFPHVVRALEGHASAGVWAAGLPFGARTDASGFQTPLYMDPTGFYSDAAQFFAHPVNFTLARIAPQYRLASDMVIAAYQARTTGQPEVLAAMNVLRRYVPLPGQVPGIIQPGTPLAARAAALAGMTTRTTPPLPDDPHYQMYEAIQRGDNVEAARIIKENNLGFMHTLAALPSAVRGPLMRVYNQLYPGRRPAESMPGFGGGGNAMPGFGGSPSSQPGF